MAKDKVSKTLCRRVVSGLCWLMAACYAPMAQAQFVTTTSNLHEHIEIIKATTSGTVTFTLAPEDPNVVARAQWPIIFIDWENDGQNVRQMINLTEEMTFTVNFNNANGKVTVTGENGTWKLVATNQEIKDVNIAPATALRYVDLSKNILGTANAGAFTFNAANTYLQTVKVDVNGLTSLTFPSAITSIKELTASENLLTAMNLTQMTAISSVDLSKNLLSGTTGIQLPSTYSTASWQKFVGADANTYTSAVTSGTSSALYTAVAQSDNYLNLTINKLNIATLPTMPAGMSPAKYFYTLQQRYVLPQSVRGDYEYRPTEEIDISSQLTAMGVTAANNTTTYKWYIEKNAATDEYEEIPATDYTVTGGKTVFKRGYGDNAKIFAAMTTAAFPNPLESYERGTAAQSTYTSGFSDVLVQPAGTVATTVEKDSYMANLTTNTLGDGTDRVLNNRFFRTNTITLNSSYNNYWYGYTDTDWSKPENWTGRFVPKTTPSEYAAESSNELRTVEFATIANFGSSAIRDLHTDQDRKVWNYINRSEKGKGLVVSTGTHLQVGNNVQLGQATVGPYAGSSDLAYRILLKSEPNKVNGSFLIDQAAYSNFAAGLRYTVELYSKAFDGNRNKQYATWQYFALPFNVTSLPSTAWIRKYNPLKNDNFDEKWEDASQVSAGLAYEITQSAPMTYRFSGAYNFTNNWSYDVVGSNTSNYSNMNILGNPFSAALDIDDLVFASGVEKTVYLFNTGARMDWLKNSGSTNVGNNKGQYTSAIPTGLAGHLSTMPKQIPTLSTFMVKATADVVGGVSYQVANLLKNTEQNRAPRFPMAANNEGVTSLTIDVVSDKTDDRLWLVTAPNTTDSYDNGYDGEKLLTAGRAQLYAMQDRNYQVSTSENVDNTALGFMAGDDAQVYEMSFRIENPENNKNIYYLVDHLTGTTTQINDGDAYSFQASKADAAHRFTIRTKIVTGIENSRSVNTIDVFADNKRNIEIRNHTDRLTTAYVYDIKGIRIAQLQIEAGATQSVHIDMPGMYIVQATNGEVNITQRVLIQ